VCSSQSAGLESPRHGLLGDGPRDRGAARERAVHAGGIGQELLPPPPRDAEVLVHRFDQAHLEVAVARRALTPLADARFPVRELVRRIATDSGAALLLDYGHVQTGFGDTLQAGRAHKVANVLENPGENDLTAHVDFEMLARTAMQAGAMPILLILNNGTYGTIRMHQEREYPGRVSGTDLENPDFVAIGKAYGFHAEKVSETGQFAAAFERAKAAGGGVIELTIATEALTPRATLTQIREAALAR